jgi:hypothetical protein
MVAWVKANPGKATLGSIGASVAPATISQQIC